MIRLRATTWIVGLMVLGSMGCGSGPWPCGDTWCGMQCGCLYWHEWFSHKPCCCDPCDCCGDYTCSRNPYVVNGPQYTRFGEVYSDGSGSNAPGAIGQMYSSPRSGQPTPAQPTPAQPEGMLDEEGTQSPAPGDMPSREELPGPTTRRPSGYGRMASQGWPVDSRYPSRTLGGAQRTRLFTR